jgi:hypothetical protein
MNNVQLYAEFISEQLYNDINELFSDKDKGYSYKKDIKDDDDPGEHFYHIDLPDNTRHAEVHVSHIRGHHAAMVGFTAPGVGYGISPEAKKTYHQAYNRDISHGHDPFDAHHTAVTAVDLKHGPDESKKAAQAWGSDTVMRSGRNSHHNYGILSTVSKILNAHAKENPHIQTFMFSSSGDHPSRERLYHAIAKKHNGVTHIDNATGEKWHDIPNPHYNPNAKDPDV